MCNNKQIVIEGHDQILYQWDTGQKLRLHGYEPGTRVDFARCNQNKAASVYAYAEGGAVFCDIPDAILMEPNHIRGFVYVIDGGKGETVRNFLLPVIPRPKPEDYVEPEEVPTWHELEQRIKKIEDEGVPDEKIAQAVENYLEENPIEIDIPDASRSAVAAAVTDGGRRAKRLMVSFMDDDCRAAVAGPKNDQSLEYLIDQKKIPYTLACAPGDMVDENKTGRFITVSDLQRMVGKGVTVSCHAWRQYNMDQFATEDAFRADLEAATALFDEWGIPVETMSYPQGRYVDEYIPTVKEFYRMGFTVADGINEIPYASYYMHRVGLFEDDANDDGTASLADAKAWVDRLAEMESGWLIFMTHAWYAGFKPALLGDLIDYIRSDDIRSKGIEIVDIHEALDTTGNVVEAGRVKKPLAEQAHPFFVVDAAGVTHTNALHKYTRSTVELTELQVGWRTGNCYLHGEKGTVLTHETDNTRRVSVDIPVNAGEEYRLACSSKWTGAAFAVLPQIGGDPVAIWPGDANREFTVLPDHKLIIPEGGTILRVSCNLTPQPEGYKIYRVEYVGGADTPEEPSEGTPGGYYTPTVSQPDANTMRVEYTPSSTEMPTVAPVQVALPAGPRGDAGTTPHIGENGNWWIGDVDTGVKASSGSSQNVDLTGYAKEAWVQDNYQPKGEYLTEVPEGYAKTEDIPTKPEDIGAQPAGNYALKTEIPSVPVQSVNGKTGAVKLSASDVGARPDNWMPTAQEVGALPNTYTPPNQTAAQVGADPKGTAATAVSEHNVDTDAHNDLRMELKTLSDRLTAFFDSDDTTLDELSEIVTYITNNKTLIESITTNKVSVLDIINNLTTNVSNKPLSAAQGVVLKGLIDGLSTGKLDASKLTEAINTALAQAKASGEFDGKDGQDGYTPQKGIDYFDGQPGKDGADGAKGDKGDKGDTGATGEKGDKGDIGATGAAGYTPVKGVDYWTDEDKSEIKSELSEELPNDETLINNVVEKVPIVKVAEPPEFVNDISECSDTTKMYVLPNGHLCAYMTSTETTEGSTVANFTNIYNTANGAYIKDGYRYSSSGAAFKEQSTDCAIVVPIVSAQNHTVTLRARGATLTDCAYPNSIYIGADNSTFGNTGRGDISYSTDANGDVVISIFVNDPTYANYALFHVAAGVDESNLIVTQDEEITYTTTEGGTETVAEWTDTGIEYNQPPDYTDRVVAVETKTSQLQTDVDALETKVTSLGSGSGSGSSDAFAYSAYPPSPQLPGDGSEEADFNVADVATSEVYAYMDALWNRYRTYMVKQNLGKDSSGEYDYYRYVFSKAYWRAWYKENYPKMYAWQNGSTVIYSESVSPRVGDTMYSTSYIGTVYSTVTAVNSETIGTASTRTVNGLEFIRYAAGDVEPTIVYTVPIGITNDYLGRTYTDVFEASSSIAEFTHEYIVDSNGVKFYRYPFEDKKLDKTRLFSVFILTNEHGNHGDSMIPSIVTMRMLKDMCENANVPFLRWLKENAIVTVIPVGNPYGGYNNSNDVNINRNYDTPGWAGSNTDPSGGTKEDGNFGAYAGDQIETQYIMNTIQQCKAAVALSGHGRGIPHSVLGEYNSSATYQGCGFDADRMFKVEEALFSMYNFGFGPNGQHLTADVGEDESYLNAGKSPSYIEYAGAVGGLIEIDDHEVGTLDSFTPLAMEQAYAEVMLVLQNWCEEALLKAI